MKIVKILSQMERLYYYDNGSYRRNVDKFILTHRFLECVKRKNSSNISLEKNPLVFMNKIEKDLLDENERLFFIEVLKTVYHTTFIPLLNTFEDSQKIKGA